MLGWAIGNMGNTLIRQHGLPFLPPGRGRVGRSAGAPESAGGAANTLSRAVQLGLLAEPPQLHRTEADDEAAVVLLGDANRFADERFADEDELAAPLDLAARAH